MRREWVAAVLAVILLSLDWAALDDITTGSEPSFTLEYLILGASIVGLGILLVWVRSGRLSGK